MCKPRCNAIDIIEFGTSSQLRAYSAYSSSFHCSDCSSASTRFGSPFTVRPTQAQAPHPASASATATTKAPAGRPLLFVKGDPETQTLLDCPFSHRIVLAMELKGLERDYFFVDEYAKPQALFDVNPAGKIPVLKWGEEIVPDSDAILQWLEAKFPEPSLRHNDAELDDIMSKNSVFPAFVEFLQEEDLTSQSAKTKEENLLQQLNQLERALGDRGGPFFGGNRVVQADVTFAPRMYHLVTALRALRQWELPSQLVMLRRFLENMKAREEWKRASYSEEVVVAGWKKKLESMKHSESQ